jgi:hypothetical protein
MRILLMNTKQILRENKRHNQVREAQLQYLGECNGNELDVGFKMVVIYFLRPIHLFISIVPVSSGIRERHQYRSGRISALPEIPFPHP